MPLQIIRNDITKIECDAIVNAANESLLGGGGVDGMIHRAAGPELLAECRTLGGCRAGQAKITGAYRLPCRYVIHTVGPRWKDGKHGEREILESCYKESLQLAEANSCESIAFPLISSGAFGYPKEQALQVAVNAISGYLLHSATAQEMKAFLVIFDKECYRISQKLRDDIVEYIDEHYVREHSMERSGMKPMAECSMPMAAAERPGLGPAPKRLNAAGNAEGRRKGLFRAKQRMASQAQPASLQESTLEDALQQIDESFSQMLLRKIDEKGMTDAECYKKANIDRKLFSKIRSDIHYRPSKTTAIAFAIALELPLPETKDMLMKAGFALSHSNKFDIIIEYFIRKQNYNIFEINEALFEFDQSLLGV